MTEDAVRDLAREALGLVDSEIARAGVGQLTTFNQLGFPGVADKPDGWYLPNNKNEVAVVLETKATRITLGQTQVDEVLKNVRIMQQMDGTYIPDWAYMEEHMRSVMKDAEIDLTAMQTIF